MERETQLGYLVLLVLPEQCYNCRNHIFLFLNGFKYRSGTSVSTGTFISTGKKGALHLIKTTHPSALPTMSLLRIPWRRVHVRSEQSEDTSFSAGGGAIAEKKCSVLHHPFGISTPETYPTVHTEPSRFQPNAFLSVL